MSRSILHHTRTRATPDPASLVAAIPAGETVAVVRDGPRTIVGTRPERILRASGPDALRALDRLEGWWAGLLTYDLGRAVERVPATAEDDLGLPDLLLGRFDTRLILDGDGARIEGDGEARPVLERALHEATPTEASAPGLRSWTSSLERDGFEQAVRTVLDHIRAGDCYQVNLTRRLTCERAADPVALFAALAQRNPAPHAALLRFPEVSVVSASPELFLRRDGWSLATRPIKGTGRDPAALAASEKDRAENVMIVDLARNDIGRVCAYGSVHVPELCAVEAHPGLHHLVSTVRGRLRPGVRMGEMVEAAFPPASITGAPKPRVMRIIEELEPVRRGVYCGSVGWFDADRNRAELSVAIRTFTIAEDRTFLGVGGGIVADSDPRAEWDETELKAARLLAAAGATA